MTVTLHLGDCAQVLQTLPDGCIDLTVTSPPYDNLRTYKGYTFDFEPIARELYRVTKPGGVVVWVVGDATINGSETGTSFRQALYFKECGFNLHDTMIYKKVCPTWNETSKRYRSDFEYMYIMAKGKPSSFNPLRDVPIKNKEPRKIKANRNGNSRYDWYIPGDVTVRSNIWAYNVGGGETVHPAPFPEALARDHILSWSNEGDTVLDPFLGSGTTGKMAVLLNRHFIGIEIFAEYLSIAEKRIKAAQAQPGLFSQPGAGGQL